MKLYRVISTWPKNGRIYRFCHSRQDPQKRPYAKLIENYVPGCSAEMAIDELFSEAEAKQFKDYYDSLTSHHRYIITAIEEEALPLPHDMVAAGAVPGVWIPKNLLLPFKVHAYIEYPRQLTLKEVRDDLRGGPLPRAHQG